MTYPNQLGKPSNQGPEPYPPGIQVRVGATLTAAFAAPFVSSIANVIPGSLNGVLQQHFHTHASQLTWITAAFLIPVVVFELTFGAIGDIFGRKRLMYLGSLLLLAGSVASVLAPTVEVMWLGAALNGLGAGALYPTSLAMVAAVVHTPVQRTRAIAAWAGFLSLGGAICPIIAGAFANAGWWQGGYVLIAVGAVITLALVIRATDSSAPMGRKLDLPGQVTFAVGLTVALWATVQGSEVGWSQPEIIIGYLVAAVLLASFIIIELRTPSPLLHLGMFRIRSFSIVGIVTVIGTFGFLIYCFSTSVWLGVLQHQNAVYIGVIWLVMQGPSFVFAPVVGRLLHSVSPRWLLSLGFALIAVGAFIAVGFDPHDFDWTKFFLPGAFIGIGWALTIASISEVSVNTVPKSLAGMGSATTNLVRDLGFALGPVIGSAIAFGTANSQLIPALGALNLPAEQAGPVLGIAQAGGAIAVNSVPTLPAGAHEVALTVLGSGFQLAFLIGAIAAAVAAVVTLIGLAGMDNQPAVEEVTAQDLEPLADPV